MTFGDRCDLQILNGVIYFHEISPKAISHRTKAVTSLLPIRKKTIPHLTSERVPVPLLSVGKTAIQCRKLCSLEMAYFSAAHPRRAPPSSRPSVRPRPQFPSFETKRRSSQCKIETERNDSPTEDKPGKWFVGDRSPIPKGKNYPENYHENYLEMQF